MNKEDLARAIYDVHGGLSQADCLRIVDFMLTTIKDRLTRGEKVLLSGFGCFRVKRRRDRRGVNPQSGAGMVIAGRNAVVFTPSRQLKAMR
jgi:nucleoid DNA-binding protein